MANARAFKDLFAAIKDLDIDYAVIALQDLGNNIKSAIVTNEIYQFLDEKNEELKENKAALAVVTMARNLGLHIVLGPAGTVVSLGISANKISQDPVTQEYAGKLKIAFGMHDPAKRKTAIYQTLKDYVATKMGSEPAPKKRAAPAVDLPPVPPREKPAEPPPVPPRAKQAESPPVPPRSHESPHSSAAPQGMFPSNAKGTVKNEVAKIEANQRTRSSPKKPY